MLMGDGDTANEKQKYEYQIMFRDEFNYKAGVRVRYLMVEYSSSRGSVQGVMFSQCEVCQVFESVDGR